MTLEPREYHATIATLTVVAIDLVEIRYHPGILFTPPLVAEVQELRRNVMGDRPHATLTIIPEAVDLRMDNMEHDQGQADRTQSQMIASAVVAKTSMVEMLTKLYLSNFPQLQRTLVTDNEQAARKWLAEQLEASRKTGS